MNENESKYYKPGANVLHSCLINITTDRQELQLVENVLKFSLNPDKQNSYIAFKKFDKGKFEIKWRETTLEELLYGKYLINRFYFHFKENIKIMEIDLVDLSKFCALVKSIQNGCNNILEKNGGNKKYSFISNTRFLFSIVLTT